MEATVIDLNDVAMNTYDPEKVAGAMPTSLSDFTLLWLLSAVGRKQIHGRGTKARACKL